MNAILKLYPLRFRRGVRASYLDARRSGWDRLARRRLLRSRWLTFEYGNL